MSERVSSLLYQTSFGPDSKQSMGRYVLYHGWNWDRQMAFFLTSFVLACRRFMFETMVLTCPLPMPLKLLYRACVPRNSTVSMCRIKDKAWRVLECNCRVERIKTDAIAMAKLAKKIKNISCNSLCYNNDCSFPWKKLGYAYHATQRARKVVGSKGMIHWSCCNADAMMSDNRRGEWNNKALCGCCFWRICHSSSLI